MQKLLYSLLFVLATLSVSANCDNTYSAASYVLNHAKKSLAANNFEHQQYYAERALEAMEKTLAPAKICGCDKAVNAIYDGMENLEKAIVQDNWDMGRYYTKKAFENTQSLINHLDIFTQLEQQPEEDTENAAVTLPNTQVKTLLEELEELKKQQIKLVEKQKSLEEKRKALEEKIAKANL